VRAPHKIQKKGQQVRRLVRAEAELKMQIQPDPDSFGSYLIRQTAIRISNALGSAS
jgi:hypothetical protein